MHAPTGGTTILPGEPHQGTPDLVVTGSTQSETLVTHAPTGGTTILPGEQLQQRWGQQTDVLSSHPVPARPDEGPAGSRERDLLVTNRHVDEPRIETSSRMGTTVSRVKFDSVLFEPTHSL